MPIVPPKIHNVAAYAFTITPSNSLTIDQDPANLKLYSNCTVMCKTTGDISFVTSDGQNITLAAVPAYFIIPIQIKQVKSTGTTGTWLAMVCTNG